MVRLLPYNLKVTCSNLENSLFVCEDKVVYIYSQQTPPKPHILGRSFLLEQLKLIARTKPYCRPKNLENSNTTIAKVAEIPRQLQTRSSLSYLSHICTVFSTWIHQKHFSETCIYTPIVLKRQQRKYVIYFRGGPA